MIKGKTNADITAFGRMMRSPANNCTKNPPNCLCIPTSSHPAAFSSSLLISFKSLFLIGFFFEYFFAKMKPTIVAILVNKTATPRIIVSFV